MRRKIPRSAIAIALILIVIPAVSFIAVHAQRITGPLPAALQNLATVQTIEVKDATGQVMLNGTFATASSSKEDVERSAKLSSQAAPGGATAEADIELEKGDANAIKSQEIEVELRKLAPNAKYTVVIDGHELATFTTNGRGNADLKFSSKMSK